MVFMTRVAARTKEIKSVFISEAVRCIHIR